MPATHHAGGSDVGREILAYLRDHPNAQDTRDGIDQWWLAERGIACDPDAVQPAIDGLVRRGLLVEIHASDGRVHYRLNAARRDEIAAMLAP
jgi:hypothetical protein